MPSPRLTGAGLLFILIAGLSCICGFFPEAVYDTQSYHHAGNPPAQVQTHQGRSGSLLPAERPGGSVLQGVALLTTLLSLSFGTALRLLLRRLGGAVRRTICGIRARMFPAPAAPVLTAPSPSALQVFRL
jgi:hypothetical protein